MAKHTIHAAASGEAAITSLARRAAPDLAFMRPDGLVEGLVFDAVVGLPNPPHVALIAHWTDLKEAQVRKAIERMIARGLLDHAGNIPRRPSGYVRTYRLRVQ